MNNTNTKTVIVNTISKNEKECIASIVISIPLDVCALMKRVILKSARNAGLNTHHSNLFKEGVRKLISVAAYDANAHYTDDTIAANLLSILQDLQRDKSKKLDIFQVHTDNILHLDFEEEKLYWTTSSIDIKCQWTYQPYIDAAIEDLANIKIEDKDLQPSDAYIKSTQLEYIKTHTRNHFMKSSDTVIEDCIIYTTWKSLEDGNEESEKITVPYNKNSISDLNLYEKLSGKSVGDVIEHEVKTSNISMKIQIIIDEISIFDLPEEITDEIAQIAKFKSAEDLKSSIVTNIHHHFKDINYEHKIAQLIDYIFSMHTEEDKIPDRYSKHMYNGYIKRLCTLFNISQNDLLSEYGRIAFVNTFVKYFNHVSHLTDFDSVSHYIQSMATKVVASRLRMLSILQKLNISKMYIQLLASQHKMSMDKISLSLLLEHLNKNNADIFYKKEILINYSDVEDLRRYANNGFWFDNK